MGERGSFTCLDRSCFNTSSTLAIPCAFMSLVRVCVCARVFVCAWPLPCKVHVPVCVRTRFFVTILRVCVRVKERVFLITQSSVSFTFSVQTVAYSLIVVKTSQRNVFIGVEEKKKKRRLYCCCKTIIHVDILSYNQPIVSLYLRYSQGSSG